MGEPDPRREGKSFGMCLEVRLQFGLVGLVGQDGFLQQPAHAIDQAAANDQIAVGHAEGHRLAV